MTSGDVLSRVLRRAARAWLALGPSVVVLLALVCVQRAGVGLAQDVAPALQGIARSAVGPDQGVFARAEDGTVLAAINADRPVHPASVTKVATTLALVRRLGPDYRFDTRVLATGPLVDGTVEGKLVVEADGDPFLVFENAFLVLLRLHGLGIRTVAGGLEVRGSLLFNWGPDPGGRRLRRALAGLEGAAAWAAVQEERGGLSAMSLRETGIRFGSRPVPDHAVRVLVVHRSPPLRRIVKELNCYSNNVFHLLSDHIGGPPVVGRIASESVEAAIRHEIVIDNAAGAGTRNRLSPRAAVALLAVLERDLAGYGLSLTDVLPVAGIDRGTLQTRLAEPAYSGAVVGKTGTFGSLGVSALSGVARTRRYGRVTFAVLNSGLTVVEARRRQDAFVRALLDDGGALPWPYRRPAAPAFTEAVLDQDGAVADRTSAR